MNGLGHAATVPMWAGLIGFVLAMLALDLCVFGGNKARIRSVLKKQSHIYDAKQPQLILLDPKR